MGFLRRVFGIPKTKEPSDKACWTYQEGRLKINLNRAVELSAPGGSLRFEGRALPRRVLVVHGRDGSFYAFLNKCRHMGRRIDPVTDRRGNHLLECCSVSRSAYDYEGKVVAGPAKGDLLRFTVEKEDSRLVISID